MKTFITYFLRKLLRDKYLSVINIVGLSIGLAVAVMLLLVVTSELSFDRHFAGSKRIVTLNTTLSLQTEVHYVAAALRKAYTEIPNKVAGIEACTQIYTGWTVELVSNLDRFRGLEFLYADPDFFNVFQLTFIEGTPQTALANPKSLVITRPYAEVIFGSTNAAIGKSVSINGIDYTIDAVTEPLPSNTHFTFDILGEIESHHFSQAKSVEFTTFYLIDSKSSVRDVRRSIEQVYNDMLDDRFSETGFKGYGETEMLTDIYLFSKAFTVFGKRSDFKFVLLISVLSFFVLLFSSSNFMNLFLVQGETRMGEIGIRKSNGAGIGDLVKQFFSEVSLITLIAFIFGLLLAFVATPYFSKLIERDVAVGQLISPWFVLSMMAVFALTVMLSAGYPAFFLSSFKPLDMLTKRINFGKRRLTSLVIIFQSAVAIVLIAYVLVMNQQTVYMENLPTGYNPKNVMMVQPGRAMSFRSLRQELQNHAQVMLVSSSAHEIGGQFSGQFISTPEDAENTQMINEYRFFADLGELMEIQLIEGRFFNENDPNNSRYIVLNRAAVSMLGIRPPYVDKEVILNGARRSIIGVTVNFCYNKPGTDVQPLILTYSNSMNYIYIRFQDEVSRADAIEIATTVFRKFDSEYVLQPHWSEDLFDKKFIANRIRSKIILFSALLSVIISTLGLLATQSFVALRREKEIGIRRIHGATKGSTFWLLMYDLAKWIVVAGVIAIPVAWWLSSNWLSSYAHRIDIGWPVFAAPMVIQCMIVALVTWGVYFKVLSTNPAEILKKQ